MGGYPANPSWGRNGEGDRPHGKVSMEQTYGVRRAVRIAPGKSQKNFRCRGVRFVTFSPCVGFFCHVFLLMGSFFQHMESFLHFHLHVGDLFCPYGVFFSTFISMWGSFLSLWGAFFVLRPPIPFFFKFPCSLVALMCSCAPLQCCRVIPASLKK